MKAIALLTLLTALPLALSAQRAIHGTVAGPDGEGLPGASIYLYANQQVGTTSNANGAFQLVVPGHIPSPTLIVSFTGYLPQTIPLDGVRDSYAVVLKEDISQLNEVVVVSGTLKEVSKLDSPVPIEVYTPTFFMKNPAPSLFESLTNVNGVRPQLNCNVCNTGDIHINGLEGPYTMVLIDGMPIVSGLSTVYGLTGIPSALIDRVEIVKGPASTLYGSEAVGGLVNVITKKPARADDLFIDQFATSWAEFNTDIGLKYNLGQKAQSVAGINYFNYQNPKDNNDDGNGDGEECGESGEKCAFHFCVLPGIGCGYSGVMTPQDTMYLIAASGFKSR